MRIYINLAMVFLVMYGVASQLRYIFQDREGNWWLRIFEMLSGEIAPFEIGLTDPIVIKAFVKLCKRILQVMRLMAYGYPIIAPLVFVSIFKLASNWLVIFFVITPWLLLLLTIVAAITAFDIISHTFIFFIIGSFFKMKLEFCKNSLIQLLNSNKRTSFDEDVRLSVFHLRKLRNLIEDQNLKTIEDLIFCSLFLANLALIYGLIMFRFLIKSILS